MMDKKRLLYIINNLFIFITTAIAVPVTLIFGSRALRLDGVTYPYWMQIVTFTLLSNIFMSIVALVAAVIAIKNHKKSQKTLNTWYFVAASACTLTFLTVVFFLSPMRALNGKNYFDMLLEPMFFLHFLNPVLAAITFVFLSGNTKINLKSRFLAVIPIALYAIPYIICVVVLKIWPDFYGVTFGGRYYLTPLVFVVFCFALFCIASGLAFFHNKLSSKNA